MGTRHLICLHNNGRIVVAQYGGHDGHPSYTGLQIVTLLSIPLYITRLRRNVHLIRHRIPNGDYSSWPGNAIDESAGFLVLDDIAYATGPLLHAFQLEFADDGAFCEWVYLVDLDGEVLEVYAGMTEFEMERMGERAVGRRRLAEVGVKQQGLRVAIPFIDLPGDKEALVKACMAGREEEEE